ncbi:MAG: amino acid adenylation domain-containing protein [Chloroflexota bacterium]
MRNAEQVLLELQAHGIKLWSEDGKLRYRAPKDALTATLRSEITKYKTEILSLLSQGATYSSVYQEIQPSSRTKALPLSFAQQRLWFLDQLGQSSSYNIPLVLDLKGPLNVKALQLTLQEIVQRHESLRTTFVGEAGTPYQVVHPTMQIELPVVDLSTFGADEQSAEVKRLTVAEATHPFDLSRDPMLRAKLLDLHGASSNNLSNATSIEGLNTNYVDYILLLTMHHIAADGWSLGVLVQELALLYEAFSQSQPSPLPALPIQYADFAVWQRSYLQGEVLEQQLKYWKEQLAGAPELLQLPTDRPRPVQQSFKGDVVSLKLDAHLTQQLRTLGQKQGTTLYMTLLAAFQVLLFRYTGQTDIVVGSPIANRNRREIEPLIGFFVNTLALRTDLSRTSLSESDFSENDADLFVQQTPSFVDVLAQVQETLQSAYDNQDIPFERLVEEFSPERNLNYNPLVQVMFALQNAPMNALELSDLSVTPVRIEVQRTRFDLEMHFWEVDDYLQGDCIYSTDLFDKTTIERMAGHFQTLLAGIITNPTEAIAELPLLTDAERHQLLFEWNDTAVEYSKDKCVHHLFEEQTERTPNAIAVVFEGKQLTYKELNERANQLAHHLHSLGAGIETLVGICVERSIEMIVGLLGVLKAGSAYVPLDPKYPPERLALMLDDAQVSLLLTQEHLSDDLPFMTKTEDCTVEGSIADNRSRTILCLDKDWSKIATQNTTPLQHGLSANNLAYAIYTSGSTGRPKGVQIEHHGLCNVSQAQQSMFGVGPDDHVLQFASFSFDAATFEIVMALCSGATLYLGTNETLAPGVPLQQFLKKHDISVVTLTPSTLAALPEGSNQELSALRTITVAGEACSGELLKQWVNSPEDESGQRRFFNLYGPTETTIWATAARCHAAMRTPPIGLPIPNVQLYILDAYRQPVPIGVSGELYIGGDSLARGYLNRPALTEERFIPNPFGDADGTGRLYATGDLVRWRSDGQVEFLGRIDHQVKLRGFRIELGEVEETLVHHPAVQDAVVLAREEQPNHKQLVGYLVVGEVDDETQSAHVEQWQTLYEDAYSQTPEQEDHTFNIVGWNSSYTGQPIPEAEMAEWVDETIADIRRLEPQQIFEIGCGSGLLLFRLAPHCAEYWGADYSQETIQRLAQIKTATPDLDHVHVEQRMADDFSGIDDDRFDCVIINSVAQYFPGIDYLLRVMEGAVRVTKPGGKIYIGDVRNLRLLQAYQAAVQTYQAEDALSLSQFQTRIEQRLQHEEELLIDPEFFYALPKEMPQIASVEVSLKRGRFYNELTQFRYQVVLHIEKASIPYINSGQGLAPPLPEQRRDKVLLGEFITQEQNGHHQNDQVIWHEEQWLQESWSSKTLANRVRQAANTYPEQGLIIRNIPNARLQDAVQTLTILDQASNASTEKTKAQVNTIAQLRTHLTTSDQGIDPTTLWSFEETIPYQVHVTWSREPGLMDAYFIPLSSASRAIDTVGTNAVNGTTKATVNALYAMPQPYGEKKIKQKPWRAYTNNPLHGKLNQRLIPKIRAWLQDRLPDYMIPAAFVVLDAFPLTPNDKVDRKALPAPNIRMQNTASYISAQTELQQQLVDIWQEELSLDQVGIHDNFFDIGGHSLLIVKIHSRVKELTGTPLEIVDFFQYPTIHALCEHITATGDSSGLAPLSSSQVVKRQRVIEDQAIAVIGIAGRFPGANSIEAFWKNLANGIESVTFFSDEELLAAGVTQEDLNAPTFVKASAHLTDADLFDADFFNFSRREAVVLDPQSRLFLECSWAALENAGCDPQTYPGAIGVFAGAGTDLYSPQILRQMNGASAANMFQAFTSGSDFLATRLAYKLNLKGPAITLQTACSTSLVATHMACQSILDGECDMALAGGVVLMGYGPSGYHYQDGMIFSPDGHCRAFDVEADGTIGGSGVGVVVLKRLEQALEDGDVIHAVIKGSAINNDGSNKVGYTAPSVDGQVAVIQQALANANVAPETISYIETHGTGTRLGDPIELTALKAVFKARLEQTSASESTVESVKDKIVLGALKTNVGHMGVAAGVAGLIKTVLALKHQALPPTLHFTQPNPELQFPNDLFHINTELLPWSNNGGGSNGANNGSNTGAYKELPRRAGVSSFGIGGTNAHVVLEEAPTQVSTNNEVERTHHLLTLSAKNEDALREMAVNYAAFFTSDKITDSNALADICYTSHVGRSHFEHRLSITGSSPQQLCEKLGAYLNGDVDADTGIDIGLSQGVLDKNHHAPKVAFLFTGQGAQYVGMGRDLYQTQPTFRATIDRCNEILQDCLGRSLVALIYPAKTPDHNDLMESHPCGQAVNFAFECALADLWYSWGVKPDFVLGHSLGDFAAAYTAGVLSLEEGLRLVTERGRLMETALGSMVSVMASEADVVPFLAAYSGVTIGVINGPSSIVISGEREQVANAATDLQAAGFKTRALAIPVAAHSPMLDPVLDTFTDTVRSLKLSAPKIPVVSSMTGQRVQDELTAPTYWRRHLRNTIRFADGVQTLHEQGCIVYLEIGPKPTLLGMAEQILDTMFDMSADTDADMENRSSPIMLPSLREDQNDWQQLLTSLGQLYICGAKIDWQAFDHDYQRHKVELPPYPFQRQRYWLDMPAHSPKKVQQFKALRPLIDKMIELPTLGTTTFETNFSVDAYSFLADHVLFGSVISPGACHVSMVLNAAELALGNIPCTLTDIVFPEPLSLPESGERTVQLILAYDSTIHDRSTTGMLSQNGLADTILEFKLISFDANATDQSLLNRHISTHAVGQLQASQIQPSSTENRPLPIDLDELRKRCTIPFDINAMNEATDAMGVIIGPSLQWLTDLWGGDDEALARLSIPVVLNVEEVDGYRVHPGLLDRCFAAISPMTQSGEMTLPFAIRSCQFFPTEASTEWWSHARQNGNAGWDLQVFNHLGEIVLEIQGFEQRAASLSALQLQQELWHQWLYQVEWQPLMLDDEASAEATTQEDGSPNLQQWLLFADKLGAADAFVEQFANGTNEDVPNGPEQFVRVHAGSSYQQVDERTFTIRPDHAEDYRQLMATLPEITDVIHWWSLDIPRSSDIQAVSDLQMATNQGCGTTLYLAQALLHEYLTPPRLHLVTQGAQATGTHLPAQNNGIAPANTAMIVGFAQSALWGMGKSIAAEHPELNCVCIDLDESIDVAAQISAFCDAITSAPVREQGENQLTLRNGIGYVPRLARYEYRASSQSEVSENSQIDQTASTEQTSVSPTPEATILKDATYLITGGLNGIGLEVAEWFVKQGATQLILMGRSQPSAEAQARLDEMRASGVKIAVARADVRDKAQVAALLAKISDSHPLRGVIHSAGVLDDAALIQQTWQHLDNVLAPKVWGTWHLHELTKEMDLDFFVLFSSGVSLMGNRGQINHAAANAFMDAFAHHRQASGLPALSINWGHWKRIGVAAKVQESLGLDLYAIGQGGYLPEQGVEAFANLLNQPVPQVACLVIYWTKFLQAMANLGKPTPFYEQFATEVAADADRQTTRAERSSRNGSSQPAQIRSIYNQLLSLTPEKRASMLMTALQTEVARILGIESPNKIDPKQGMMDIGVDSLMAVEFRNRVSKLIDKRLPATLVFDYPTLEDMSAYILQTRFSQETVSNAPSSNDTSMNGDAVDASLDGLSNTEMLDLLVAELDTLGI